jgi:hypothetical protein
VIDRTKSTLYVIAYILDPGGDPSEYKTTNKASFFVFKLDLLSGKVLASSKIAASAPGWHTSGKPRTIIFDSTRLNQRPGLLLANDRIYAAFASLYGDDHGYHGWVLGFNRDSLMLERAFTASPEAPDDQSEWGQGVGIWQAGHGIAADPSGSIYVMTGNGRISPGKNYPISFLKLDKDLNLLDSFTPFNAAALNYRDEDLGSSGPVILNDLNFVAGGGKEGKVYALPLNNLGTVGDGVQVTGVPIDGQKPSAGQQTLPNILWIQVDGQPIPIGSKVDDFTSEVTHHIHGGPVLWKNSNGYFLYVWGENDCLRMMAISASGITDKPIAVSPVVIRGFPAPASQSTLLQELDSMPGGILSLSANGESTGTGVLWATHPINQSVVHQSAPGVLEAYQAYPVPRSDGLTPRLRLLWSSVDDADDSVGLFAKFCPATVTNGKVYLATFSGKVIVYGLLTEPRTEQKHLAAVSWAQGRIDLLFHGADQGVRHKVWNGGVLQASQSTPDHWDQLGGFLSGAPAAVSWVDDKYTYRLDIFGRGADGSLLHKAWIEGKGWQTTGIDAWETLGGQIVGAPSASSWAPNRIDVFARGIEGEVWHKAWDGSQWIPYPDSPDHWERLGGQIVGPPAAVCWGSDRIDVFARGTDGAVWHKAWDGSQWIPYPDSSDHWERLGGQIVGPPVAVSWGLNRIDVFARGIDGAVWHKAWDVTQWIPYPDSSDHWELLGGQIVGPPVALCWPGQHRRGPKRIDVFARGSDGAVWHKAWDGTQWRPGKATWDSLGW